MPAHALRRRPTVSARLAATLAVLLAGAVALLGATALTVSSAAPAAAHDRLVSADPKDGATLDAPPSQIVLTFSAEVLPSGAQVAVTTPDGSVDGETSVDGEVVTADLPGDLPAGGYEVTWRVVSSDGHPIEGELSYDVAAAAGSEDESAEEPGEEPEESPSPTGTGSTDAADPTDDASATDAAGGHDHPTGAPGAELGENGEAGWAASWLFGVAVIALVAVAAALVLHQRRMRRELDDREPPRGEDDAPSDDDRLDDQPDDDAR